MGIITDCVMERKRGGGEREGERGERERGGREGEREGGERERGGRERGEGERERRGGREREGEREYLEIKTSRCHLSSKVRGIPL